MGTDPRRKGRGRTVVTSDEGGERETSSTPTVLPPRHVWNRGLGDGVGRCVSVTRPRPDRLSTGTRPGYRSLLEEHPEGLIGKSRTVDGTTGPLFSSVKS